MTPTQPSARSHSLPSDDHRAARRPAEPTWEAVRVAARQAGRPASGLAGPRPTGRTMTGAATYEIRVAGHLDDHWAATLGAHTLVRLPDDTTSLTGSLVDQAQLHGLLTRIRDLGVPLLMLRTLDGPVPQPPPSPSPDPASGTGPAR